MKKIAKEDIIENSIISVGRYEILFCSFPTLEDGTDKAIQYLNNARVVANEQLRYEITYNQSDCNISRVKFIMPSDDNKLSDVFENLPWGIIKKNRTGVGATTLELNSPRHSIIVVPTRALALNKALPSRIIDTDRYRVLYVGGDTTGVKVPSIEEYLSDNNVQYKKFIVVIDSLPRLLNKLGEDYSSNYFIMFDEVDTYQDSSHYRGNIENSFDYYFTFPFQNRCLVSATVTAFSNPKLLDEPIIEVEFNNPKPQDIRLECVDNPLGKTKEMIIALSHSHPNEKIVIALNLVTRGILPIIEDLPIEIQRECSVLCSESNQDNAGEYYAEIVEGVLPSRIVFMTNIYFVGVDIIERFHLICTAEVKHPFTLFSVEKLQQITGRCRDKEGVLSETIIYNYRTKEKEISLESIRQQLIEDALDLSDLSTLLSKVYHKYPGLNEGSHGIKNEDLMNVAYRTYFQSSPISIIREKGSTIHPSFFNIDNILIQVHLLNNLYSTPYQLRNALLDAGNNVNFHSSKVDEENIISTEAFNTILERKILTTEEERAEIIEKLRERETIESRYNLALNLKNNCNRENTVFFEHFIELQKYVPFEQLVTLLSLYDKANDYKAFRNGVLYWVLEEEHPVKRTLKANFQINSFMTGETIAQAFNSVYSGILGYEPLSQRAVFTKIDCWVKLSARTSTTINGERINGYRVINLNPFGLEENPLERISADTDMERIFKF